MEISLENIPKHIGIIMDGNGRWATQRGLKRSEGHNAGASNVIEITKTCSEIGVKVLSLYAFSTENWKRPEDEVGGIMKLLNYFIDEKLDELHANNVKLSTMGDLSKLPMINRMSLSYAKNKTKNNTGLILNIGLNYGGRAELVNAFHLIHQKLKKGEIDVIGEDTIYDHLYTASFPELDLLVRTGGDYRISNFMIYQLAYSELYFTDVLWPDFDKDELYKAIGEFQRRNRRFGGLNE